MSRLAWLVTLAAVAFAPAVRALAERGAARSQAAVEVPYRQAAPVLRRLFEGDWSRWYGGKYQRVTLEGLTVREEKARTIYTVQIVGGDARGPARFVVEPKGGRTVVRGEFLGVRTAGVLGRLLGPDLFAFLHLGAEASWLPKTNNPFGTNGVLRLKELVEQERPSAAP